MSVIFSAVIKHLLKKKDDALSPTADLENTNRDPRGVLPQETVVPDVLKTDTDPDVR